MKTDKINSYNTNFCSVKPRYITDNMKASVESLLIRMNADVSRVTDGDHFKTTMTTKLHYNDIASFEDERRLTTKLNQKEQIQGFSVLKIGKKTVLDIDNKSGEIIDFIKPFYKPWFFVIKQAERILSDMRTNFYDISIVRKESLTVNELTPDGKIKIKQLVKQVEKQRLENLLKNLE